MRVIAVQLQDVHPPKEVSDAFKDVASAREDKSRIINEAEAYRNELIPKARGLAAEVENQAQAYKETRIRNAEGEANRFLALLKEYEQAKDVTKQRMYLETMEEILSRPAWKSSFSRRTPPIACCRCCRSCNPPRPPGRLRPKNNLPGPSFRKQP